MSELDFLVSRRGTDPADETCLVALRDLLGAEIAGVERGELWRFEVAEGDAAALAGWKERLERAACHAGRYVNTNRDRCTWTSDAGEDPIAAPRGGTIVEVWVCDGDGRDAAALAYFRARSGTALAGLRRGTLWRLWFAATDAETARARASELAVTRTRRLGLLSNPQSQRAEIIAVIRDPAAKEDR
jgi:hypothetical protein